MTRVIVTGSREWNCTMLAERVVARLASDHGEGLVIVHGAARGVDSSFAAAAMKLNVVAESHPADWDGLGKGAGPIRNQAMLDAGASMCLAFHPDLATSKGTKDMVRRAVKAGVPTWLTDRDGGAPVRQHLPASKDTGSPRLFSAPPDKPATDSPALSHDASTLILYALGMRTKDGTIWLACREPSRSGPIRTPIFSAHLAHKWESPEDIQAWLDTIPETYEVKGKQVADMRKWMRGLTLFAVPVVTTPGDPIPLNKERSS